MKLCSDYKLSKVFNIGKQPNWNRKTKQGLLCVFRLKRALTEVKAAKMYRMIYVIRNLPKAVCVCVFQWVHAVEWECICIYCMLDSKLSVYVCVCVEGVLWHSFKLCGNSLK